MLSVTIRSQGLKDSLHTVSINDLIISFIHIILLCDSGEMV